MKFVSFVEWNNTESIGILSKDEKKVIAINEIISDVANKIQIELDNKGKEDIEIALRKFYWI